MITWTQVWNNLKNRTSFPKIYKDEQKAKKKKKEEEERKKKQEAEAAKEENKEETKEITQDGKKEISKDEAKEESKELSKEDLEIEQPPLTDLEVIVKIFGTHPSFFECVFPIPLRADGAKKVN